MTDEELDLVTSWAEGWLTGAAAARAETLAAADPELAAHAAWVRTFRAQTSGVEYLSPSSATTDAVLGLFDLAPPRPSLLRRIQAALTSDSRDLGLAGVRSPLRMDAGWDLVYAAEDLRVVLSVQVIGQGLVVLGQVLGAAGAVADASVCLFTAGRLVEATVTDAHGEFEFPVTGAAHELTVATVDPAREIAVSLDLRDPRPDA